MLFITVVIKKITKRQQNDKLILAHKNKLNQ